MRAGAHRALPHEYRYVIPRKGVGARLASSMGMSADVARPSTFEAVVTGELDQARRRCKELEQLLGERDAQIASLNGQLDHAEKQVRAAVARGDALERDKARVEARAAELFEDGNTSRREIEKLRLKLELATAHVGEAQLERDRAQSNLAKVTNCLAECQLQLHEAQSRDAAFLKELNELRALVDAHQEEVQVITEARRQVQGVCEELQRENERLRAEAKPPAAPASPAEAQVKPAIALVNVAR